jgi:Ferrochelatase
MIMEPELIRVIELFQSQQPPLMQPVETHNNNRVLISFAKRPLCGIGWINHDMLFIKWSQPNLEQAAKSLIRSGAQTIVFKPLGWVNENYETILDVEDAIESLQRQYPSVTYTRLECVNDNPDFLSIAAAWANPQIEAMLSLPQGFIDASSTAILYEKDCTDREHK